MKKILYISYDGMTDQLGQSQVIPYLKELTKLGYQFTLLSMEKKNRLTSTGPLIEKQLKEAGIAWETLTFTTRPPIISKIYDQHRLNRKAAALHRKNNFDLVHCRSYVSAEAGLLLSRRTGIPFLFDMRGFWVDERVDSGLWNRRNPFYNSLYKIYKKKEKNYFQQASHVISLTEKGKIELSKNYSVPAEKITVIPCCADMNHFDFHSVSESQRVSAKNELSIPANAKVLSYLGSLGGWYLTAEMMNFFAMLKRSLPDAIFLFITHDRKEDILQLARQRGVDPDAIRVRATQRAEVPLYLSISNWNIFFIKDVYSKKASSPTKQGEVMAMGIPLICNDIGDTGKIVEETNTGVMVKSFDGDEYSKGISSLNILSELDREMIRKAAIKYYDLHDGVKRYDQVYKKLLN